MKLQQLAFGGLLVATGYVIGASTAFVDVRAQDPGTMPSEDAARKIAKANDELKTAVEALKLESRYESVTKTINSYSVLVGGLNAKEDLEAGHGVDPETFAALYTAAYEIKKANGRDDSLAEWVDLSQLDYDAEGRLTYGGKVVRIYPVSKLKKLRAQRIALASEKAEKKPATE